MVSCTSGLEQRFRYQDGWRSSPPYEATSTTRSSSCTGDVSIVVRRWPLLRPTVSSITTGMPKPRLPSRPPLSRNTVRWTRFTMRAPGSGMAGDAANDAPGSLWSTDAAEVASRLAAILDDEQAAALVTYDETGIYGHPDHLQVHRAAAMAASRAGTPTVYEATVDREYLHFVETH